MGVIFTLYSIALVVIFEETFSINQFSGVNNLSNNHMVIIFLSHRETITGLLHIRHDTRGLEFAYYSPYIPLKCSVLYTSYGEEPVYSSYYFI